MMMGFYMLPMQVKIHLDSEIYWEIYYAYDV